MARILSSQGIDKLSYEARRSGDKTEIINLVRDNVADVNASLKAWSKAGLSTTYNPKQMVRVLDKLGLSLKNGNMTVSKSKLSRLPVKDLRAVAMAQKQLLSSKVASVQAYYDNLQKKTNTLASRNKSIAAVKDKLTPQIMHDFWTSDSVQYALKNKIVDSSQLLDDFARYIDEDKNVDTFTDALLDYLTSPDKFASYWDFIK